MNEEFKQLLCQYKLLIIKRDNFRSGKIYLSTNEKIKLLEEIDSFKDEIVNYCLTHFLINQQTKLFD